MKISYFFGIGIFSILFVGLATVNIASANNGTDNMGSLMNNSVPVTSNVNPCSTGVLDSQGLCSQPTLNSQNNVITQGGTIPSASSQKGNPNTYWCKPGTSDSNLCWMNSQSNSQVVNSQAGVLSNMNSSSTGSQMMSTQSSTQGINYNAGGIISLNSLVGLFTDPNAVCATGMMMESQGLCVNSQGIQSYYSPANCNFGIDPATNQCSRTMNPMPNMFSQGGMLSTGLQNTNTINQNMSSNNILGMNSTMGVNSQQMNSNTQTMNSTGMNPAMTH